SISDAEVISICSLHDRMNLEKPKLYITSMITFNDTVNLVGEDIVLPFNNYSITFSYIGISLTEPDDVLYQYKLEGYDREWSEPAKLTQIIYPKLLDDRYVFKIRAANNEGIWTDEEVSLSFIIKPPFWRTTWFLTTMAIIFLALVLTVIKLRTMSLEQKKRELEEQVSLRTKQLREKTEQISLMFESLPVVTYMTDVDIENTDEVFKFTYISQSCEKITGYTLKDFTEKTDFWEEHIHPDDLTRTNTRILSLLVKGVVELDYRFRISTGEYRWFRSLARVITFDDGSRKQVGLWQDITEHKLAEEKLSKSEENHRLIVNNSQDVIFSQDHKGKLISANPAFLELVGYEHTDIIGSSIEKLGIVRKNKDLEKYYDAVFKHTQASGFLEIITSEGKHKLLEYRSNKRKEKGKDPVITVFGRDVTEKNKADQEIRKLNGELELRVAKRTKELRHLNTQLKLKIDEHVRSEGQLKEINKELDTFVYKATHDLKGPLASIIGLVGIARNTKDGRENYLDLIGKSTKRLDNILNNLLEATAIKQGSLEISNIKFQRMVEDVINSLNHGREEFSIDFEIDISPDLEFFSDRNLILSILQNLIGNAMKYANNMEKHPYIHTMVRPKETGIEIKVSDNGIGIAEDVKDKIFDLFYRGTTLSQGTGLGLYIVKTAVTKLNGSIDVDSEVDKGSTFTVFLKNSTHWKAS
ncbi:MAG: PAS domain S-box protein, partial [Bacteroidetes bacterium]|nr:PAS domain S-box protein [Bacteroidota bacterium]